MNKVNQIALVCVTVIALAAIIGTVVLLSFAKGDAEILAGLIFTGSASLIATVVNLARTEQVKGTVDDLANGKMDAKIRAGVADVLADHFIDPAAVAQIARDRTRRNA